jgi:hypothetical protein
MRKHTYEIRKAKMKQVIESHDKVIAYHEKQKAKVLINLEKLENEYREN